MLADLIQVEEDGVQALFALHYRLDLASKCAFLEFELVVVIDEDGDTVPTE
jgi:hypothetical protein